MFASEDQLRGVGRVVRMLESARIWTLTDKYLEEREGQRNQEYMSESDCDDGWWNLI